MSKMRLTPEKQLLIIQCFQESFQKEDSLWLFGSRVDDAKKGGDIDLYVETSLNIQEAWKAKLNFLKKLVYAMGDQKIDVVVHSAYAKTHLPIYDIAKDEGIKLA